MECVYFPKESRRPYGEEESSEVTPSYRLGENTPHRVDVRENNTVEITPIIPERQTAPYFPSESRGRMTTTRATRENIPITVPPISVPSVRRFETERVSPRRQFESRRISPRRFESGRVSPRQFESARVSPRRFESGRVSPRRQFESGRMSPRRQFESGRVSPIRDSFTLIPKTGEISPPTQKPGGGYSPSPVARYYTPQPSPSPKTVATTPTLIPYLPESERYYRPSSPRYTPTSYRSIPSSVDFQDELIL